MQIRVRIQNSIPLITSSARYKSWASDKHLLRITFCFLPKGKSLITASMINVKESWATVIIHGALSSSDPCVMIINLLYENLIYLHVFLFPLHYYCISLIRTKKSFVLIIPTYHTNIFTVFCFYIQLQ